MRLIGVYRTLTYLLSLMFDFVEHPGIIRDIPTKYGTGKLEFVPPSIQTWVQFTRRRTWGLLNLSDARLRGSRADSIAHMIQESPIVTLE